MIRGRREAALEPVRVVVELTASEFTAIGRAAGGQGPADYLRLLALLAVRTPERVP